MAVVARFYVQSINRPEPNSSSGTQIAMGAVCRGAANSEWSSATPAGYLNMTVRNESAIAQFEQVEEYELLFRKVEKPVEGDGHSVQAFRPSYSTHLQCAVCGFYPGNVEGKTPNGPDAQAEDLDWSKHDEHFKPKG